MKRGYAGANRPSDLSVDAKIRLQLAACFAVEAGAAAVRFVNDIIVERAGPWYVARESTLMRITIEIAPGLEQQLRQEAARAGLAPDAYIMQAVQGRLTQTSHQHRPAPRLSPEEAQLLATIEVYNGPCVYATGGKPCGVWPATILMMIVPNFVTSADRR